MNMHCKITFTMTAEQDLKDIGFYILNESKSLDITLCFLKRLRSSVDHLSRFPESGSNPRNRVLINMGYKFVAEGDYLTFYKFEKETNTVYIVAVLYGKMNYVKTLKKRF